MTKKVALNRKKLTQVLGMSGFSRQFFEIKQNILCSILFHLLVPGGECETSDIPHRPIGPYTLESTVFLFEIFYVKKTGLLQMPLGGWKQVCLGKCQFGRNWKNVNTPPMELIEKVPLLSEIPLSSKRYFFGF